jgi:ppGpp synthetase/RelA/SpoT-type nucleotidyltranferase
MIDKSSFLKKYNIKDEAFQKTGLNWKQLETIYDDYIKYRTEIQPSASFIAQQLQNCQAVHSVKYRLKEPEHLVEKIIRIKIEKPERNIGLDNYKKDITDLIGARALHLFKEEWIEIHKYIKDTFLLKGQPVANIREGDSPEIIKLFKEQGCLTRKHPFGYRSIHYNVILKIRKKEQIAEIQVRTIFEEGWSEIDHKLRYPYDKDNATLNQFLLILNRLAGSADEMGTFIKYLKGLIQTLNTAREKDAQLIQDLTNKLKSVKINSTLRDDIESSLKKLYLKPLEDDYTHRPYRINEYENDLNLYLLKEAIKRLEVEKHKPSKEEKVKKHQKM